jgi:UDP-N-acetylglucosamine 2-epimerase (non-hydrolysing)
VPDVDLNLMEEGQMPTQVAARVLAGMEPLLVAEQPDWVLVQGDTTTVMATAIAAHHQRVRVGHVEAGLRTGDRWNPFPEEMNRVLTDHLSDLHFAPTEQARQDLLREGIAEERIHVTGNTVIDALLDVATRPWKPEPGTPLAHLRHAPGFGWDRPSSKPETRNPKLILVTAHRRENFGRPLEEICAALRELARRDDVHLVYPVHPNPHVRDVVHGQLAGLPRITLLPPLNYQELVYLLKHCTLVLTDSGGLQEEAPSLGKPVLVLREKTERPEAVEAGTARVVGTRREAIVAQTCRLLDDPVVYAAMAQAVNPYGDGHAAERIVAVLLEEERESRGAEEQGRQGDNPTIVA